MILDDFVMLGTTVPEPNRDGRTFVCSAGVSRSLRSLVRIYPLARRGVPNRWGVYRVELERNDKDNRHESWRIAGDRSPAVHEGINQRFERVGTLSDKQRADLLRPFTRPSIAAANNLQVSLAVIEPRECLVDWRRAATDDEDSPQLSLFDLPGAKPSKPGARFEWVPRLVFRDEAGQHDLQLRDWGAYELMRKYGYEFAREHLSRALHLRDGSSLLVGNQANRRTSWLVISVLNGTQAQPNLWDRLPSDRPYIPPDVRERVMKRDSGICQDCGRKATGLDHIWPAIRGGQSVDANLRAVCTSCNSQKGDLVTA